MTPVDLSLPLVCHPATPSPLALQLSVTLKGMPAGLELHYRLSGDVEGVLMPPAAAAGLAGPTDGLWQHSCFEAFVSPVLAAHYREFNFAPSEIGRAHV